MLYYHDVHTHNMYNAQTSSQLNFYLPTIILIITISLNIKRAFKPEDKLNLGKVLLQIMNETTMNW